ncbi:MAG: hypothetical protein RL238_124 [Actinomycetota bacterium]
MRPFGVVTFLMTDIVGSTPLWERAPHLMDIALQRHDALIDEAVLAHRGFLLRHRGEGDSTFSVFQSTADAVAAAVEAQRRLAAEPWHELTPMAVRMGVHCGEVVIRDGEYHGRTINRTARVRSLAGGGQVFLSGAAAQMVAGELPERTELRFLRMEVLRGIETAEAIHEVVDLTRPLPEVSVSDDGVDDTAPASLPAPVAATLPRFFTGRTDHTRRLQALRDEALTATRVVLLGGEPGAGKSTLAAVSARDAHAAGWQVAFGSCDEAARVPYEAVRDLVTTLVDRAPRALLAEHTVQHGGELGRLTPRLTARLGAMGPLDSSDIDTTRRLLVDAVVDLVTRLAAAGPQLLIFDDIQWADRNTLHVLEALAASSTPGLFVVCTYRDGHAERGDFGGWFARLCRLDGVTALSVRGLGGDEALQFVEQAAGHPLGAEGPIIADYLMAETGGNPFYMVEVLRLLRQERVVATGPDGKWHLQGDLAGVSTPHSVRAVLEERLGRLGSDTVRILEAAAVLGRDFDPLVVAEIIGSDELGVLDRLEPAATASLVREQAAGTYEFSHALVQHTLYDTIGATRRGALHRKAAQVIEGLAGATPPAAILADHWARTGRNDRAEVCRWAHVAGLADIDALAPEDAVVWFERALASCDDPARRLDVMIELGKAQRWLDSNTFRTTLLAAASLAEQLGDGPSLVRAALANHRGGASRAGEVDRERVPVLEKALAVVGTADSADRALLLATIAQERSQGDEIERSIALADEAIDVARRVGDDYTLFLVLLRVTEATRIPATLDRRLIATRELFDIAERLDDPVQMGFAAVRDIRTKFEAARFDDVGHAFEVLDAVSHFDPFVQHNHASLQAVRAQMGGDLDTALHHAERARRLGLSENDAAAVYVATASMVLWDMGRLDSMLPLLERIQRDFPGVVGFRPSVGLGLVSAGRDDEARAILAADAAQQFTNLPLNPLWAMTISVYASLCIEVGDADAARTLYDLMAPQRGRANISVVSANGLVTESLAALAVVAGMHTEALDDALEALDQANRLHAPVSATRTRLTLARWATATGDTARQRSYAAEALAEAERLGMRRVADQARSLLAPVTT